MTEQIVTKQHMDALRGLADTNLKISEARNILIQLQETETDYLVSREKKAVDRIHNVLVGSSELVAETNKNYEAIADYSRSISEGTEFLRHAHEVFGGVISAFEKKQEAWEESCKKEEEKLDEVKTALHITKVRLEADMQALERAKVKLQNDVRKIEDNREELNRAINRLKENRI